MPRKFDTLQQILGAKPKATTAEWNDFRSRMNAKELARREALPPEEKAREAAFDAEARQFLGGINKALRGK
jgi:hypothetical protein